MSDYEKYLFRGKRKDNGEWVEGFYGIDTICTEQDTYLSTVISKIPKRIYDCESWEVDPETVGRYTGAIDKNRTKIFEGDIVTGYFNYEKIIGYIFYGGNAQFFIQRDGILGIGLDNADCWLGVIGNIHDNPELLGGENNGNN